MNWKDLFPQENRYFETDNGILYCGDCRDILKSFPQESIDLIIADPPYNIGKSKEWDKWMSMESYLSFMGEILKQVERVLKFTGSFYIFHSDFPQVALLHIWIDKNTKFVFQNLIVWNKRFNGSKNKGYLDGFISVDRLRKYQQMAEYILFYTFEADVNLGVNNFKPLRQYFKELQGYIGLKMNQINKILGHSKAEHCFRWNSLQWNLPTKETYDELIKVFGIDKWEKFKSYEELKSWFENLRYTFNNQKTYHSVWNYDFEEKKAGHITPKPVQLIKNILLHSSNEKNLVLDPFIGSGATAVACERLNRRWIGIEISEKYCEIAKERILREKENLL